MDANGLQKVVELGLNASKVAANLSEAAKRDKAPKQDNRPPKETSQPHNQTVEVKVGTDIPSGNQTPKIVKEKTETHVHKHFPDNREMSKDECDLERYRLELEYKDKQAEREFRQLMEENRRKDQKERDEYARKLDEQRKAEAKKSRRTARIIGGVLAGLGVGFAGYCLYTDIRNNQCAGLAFQSLPEVTTKAPKKLIKAEGIVK